MRTDLIGPRSAANLVAGGKRMSGVGVGMLTPACRYPTLEENDFLTF
jgi:hypothetical protein